MPPKTRKQSKRSASGNAARSTTTRRTQREQTDRKKAAEENQTYLHSMLTATLSQNAMANYSQSGHEFVDVEMQDSMSEMEQSFSNPLLGVPGTSSAFGSVLTTTQNSARNEHVQDVQSSTLASTTKKAENEPEVALEHLPEVNDKQINNASEEVVGKAVSGAQNTCNQVPTSENAVSSDSETGIELPVGHNALLLKRCNKQSESLRKYKKKINDKDTEIAQLKDLVVHAVSEAKAAKEDPNAKETFTPDVNLNITTADIENINALSKNVGVFAQNLAIHLYGADELCKRSVTGRNYKGTSNGYEPKPALSPTKLDFIYSTTKQRVALQVGQRNHEQISSLAHKSIINRALAEKIANLNKARKIASVRNAPPEAPPENQVEAPAEAPAEPNSQ